jgi:hypothetical protein
MNTVSSHKLLIGVGLLLLTGLCGCVATGPGYDGGGVVYVGGYYEPYGAEYGGWGRGYHVAPPRGGERRPDHAEPRAYHPAPSSHPTPSLPTHGRDH